MNSCFSHALPEDFLFSPTNPHPSPTLAVFKGEGVGPEVVDVAMRALQTLGHLTNRHFDLHYGGAIGKDSLRQTGTCLPEEALDLCKQVFAEGGAAFCGPGGGRFVYELRKTLDLFCKFTPLLPDPALADASIVRPERLEKVDIVAVRENAGGLYFCEESSVQDTGGLQQVQVSFGYHQREVNRILRVAAKLAMRRRGRVCVVVKLDGVPIISRLWVDEMETLRKEYAVECEVLDIDNATYQMIADPQRFDVIVSPNMFGDVLADCGALLLGSRGMSYSGNFTPGGLAVYQTGHGAAYDLAGTDRANPVGQVLSLAMMLEETFGWTDGARMIRKAVSKTFAQGIRTFDIAGHSNTIVGTREMGEHICRNLESLA